MKELTSSKQWRSKTKKANVSQKNKIFLRGGVLLRIVYTHNNRRSQGTGCPSTKEQQQLPYPRGRSRNCSKSTEEGKAAGVNTIPSELVEVRGEVMMDILLVICNKIWRTGEWPTPWTHSLVIILPIYNYVKSTVPDQSSK